MPGSIIFDEVKNEKIHKRIKIKSNYASTFERRGKLMKLRNENYSINFK